MCFDAGFRLLRLWLGWAGIKYLRGGNSLKHVIDFNAISEFNEPMNQSPEPDHLTEKAYRYRKLLNAALSDHDIVPDRSSHLYAVAKDYLVMAESYYKDGVHFLESDGDYVNALVAFSYGHAFIDAGVRLGVFCLR